MKNQINVLRGDFNKQEENLGRNLNNDMRSILGSFFQNQASTSGTLSSNTMHNPKGEMKAITTCRGLAYEGPSIPINSSIEKVVERDTEEKTNKEHSNCQGSTAHIQPLVVLISIPEHDILRTQPKSNIPYPSRLNDQKLHEKATNQIEKFFQIFHDLHFDISFADALLLMPKFASTIKSLLTNKDKLFELQKVPLNENCSAMLLKNFSKSLEIPTTDISITRPKGVVEDVFIKVGKFHFPTDFVVVDFEADLRVPLILRRSFLRIGRALIDVYGEEITLKGDILYLERLLNEDPFQLPSMDLKQEEKTKGKSSIKEPPELELKELPSHLEYAFLEYIDKLPVIIAKNLKDVEKEALIKVLKSHKQEIAWKISDIKGTFQRCMIAIFYDMIEKTMKVFMDDFLVLGDSFSSCLSNLDKMLKRCEDANLVSNWEKCHFMCKEGIVLGHKISNFGIEVDREKVDVIATLPHPTPIKCVRSFLGQAGFYRCFIQDFSEIARPMTHLLKKETLFVFSKECVDAFDTLKKKLTEAPILVVPDWKPFELMYDASDFKIDVVLGHHKLDDALWAFRTTFKTQIGCTPYKLTAGDQRKLKLNELRVQAYENSLIYKERTKKLHDSKIKNRIFKVFPYGTVELSQPNGPNCMVNGHRVKHYFRGDIPSKVVPDLHSFPMDK
nr:reverse transcriptase domain-containing protein [Tanacetum cinerariifolium]